MLILAAALAIFVYGMTAAMLGTILPDLSARCCAMRGSFR
jgi:hypothetical protein